MNIVFDIGGTNMRIAAAHGEEVGEISKVPTPQNPDEAMQAFITTAERLAQGEKIEHIAGSIRGTIVNGVFQKDKRLVAWEGLPIVRSLEDGLHAPLTIVHDTAAIGIGEVHKGAGIGSKICAYITVSTGVGGDRIVDGGLDRETYNPEIGRQVVQGVELEDLISGPAVSKKYGVAPKDLDSIDARNELADILAVAPYNTCLHWTPDTIVLGGSMIVGVNPIPLERARDAVHARLVMYPEKPRVVMAALGDNGGLVGAAIMASKMR